MSLRLSLLLLCLSIPLMAFGTVSAVPRMTLPVDSLDFGYSPQQGSISCRFWIYSTGQDTLRISNVRTSCGCTQAPLEKRVLAPGDSAVVEIIFSTGQYSGRVTKTAHISSNTGEPEKRLVITTDVLANVDSTYPIVVSPYVVDLNQAKEANAQQMKFTIQNVSGQEIAPSLLTWPKDFYDIKLPKHIKAGGSAEGTVRVKPGASAAFMKSYTIALNDDKNSRFTMLVKRNAPAKPASPAVQPAVGH
jgi:hypothetical protein